MVWIICGEFYAEILLEQSSLGRDMIDTMEKRSFW